MTCAGSKEIRERSSDSSASRVQLNPVTTRLRRLSQHVMNGFGAYLSDILSAASTVFFGGNWSLGTWSSLRPVPVTHQARATIVRHAPRAR
jgi:hypothetical protein